MTPKAIRLLVLITLLVHGIGHIQGVIAGLGVKFTSNTSNISWLLKSLGENTNGLLCMVLYTGAAIAGILAGLGFADILIPKDSWQVFGLLAAIFSTASLVLFPNALAMFFNKTGAIAVNLIIFYSILLSAHWPSAAFED